MKIAVVILNWNGKRFLEQFLPAVIQYSEPLAEVIIADNDSHDGSVEFLRDHFPQIRTIILDKNYGFAEGYNRAFRQIDADYYILLNSDIEVTPGWIRPVIDLMEKDTSVGACQPKLRSFYDRDMFEYAGAAGGFIDRYGYPFCRGRMFQVIEKDEGQYDQPEEIFWATGACMFVKSNVYWEAGGLDDDFFAHMEEIDFCWRLKNRGYKIMFCPDSIVYHIGGGTLPKNNSYKTYLNIRNNLMMLFKNLPSHRLWFVYFVRIILDLVASIKFLVDGGFKDLFAVFRAHGHFLSHIGRHYKKRRQIPKQRISRMYQGSIVFNHYLRRVKKFTDLNQRWFS